MKLLTEAEILAAAQESDEAARICSVLHWKQILDLGAGYHKANKLNLIGITADWCAVCIRSIITDKCILRKYETCDGSCCAEFTIARNLMYDDFNDPQWSNETIDAINALIRRLNDPT